MRRGNEGDRAVSDHRRLSLSPSLSGNKTFIQRAHIHAHTHSHTRRARALTLHTDLRVLLSITDQRGEKYSRSTTLKVNMYAHALIRASFGFVGLCLVAFVQQSASGSRTTPGRSVFLLFVFFCFETSVCLFCVSSLLICKCLWECGCA